MKRYLEYKESGVDWIGEIPKHWEVVRSKHLFGSRNQRGYESEPLLSVTQDRGILPRNELDYRVWNPEGNIRLYKLVSPGDWVISLRTFEGGIELSEVRGIVSAAYTTMFPRRQIFNSYFKYLLKSVNFIAELNRITTGIRQGKNISYEDFSDTRIAFPLLSEQKAIGNFLDRKTGQIDELIRIKEQRIELLQEQRTALINQVVTKGLDPNVEMKPSGVEWIGEIPRHWTLTKLKYISNIPVTYGLNIEADRYTTEGTRLIRITDIDENGGLRQKGVYLSEDCVPQEQMLNSYDLLLSRSGATVGKSYLHLEEGIYTSAGYLVRFNFGDYYTSKFIYYVTLSHFYRNWLEQQIIISTIQNVNGEKYSNFQLPIPLYQERKQIVAFLDRKTQQIDELISAERRKIELLKEYRQSLISEAVTGKIDVRNEV